MSSTFSSMSEAPIGVFDSGVGGLSVLQALQKRMPNEDFLYLADSLRVPYGSKSKDIVVRYTKEAIDFLFQEGVKAIVVACNTASSLALPDLKVGARVFGVIEPAVQAAGAYPGRIGVIGTVGTIESQSYQQQLAQKGRHYWAKACPLLVPVVEEGLSQDPVADVLCNYYLQDAPPDLGSLILGCTHYPFLAGAIARVLPTVPLIDSAEPTAGKLWNHLQAEDLLARRQQGSCRHFVTGDPGVYRNLARRLGSEPGTVRRVELGSGG